MYARGGGGEGCRRWKCLGGEFQKEKRANKVYPPPKKGICAFHSDFLFLFGKEQAYLTTCELNIHGDVVAAKITAKLASLLGMVKRATRALAV